MLYASAALDMCPYCVRVCVRMWECSCLCLCLGNGMFYLYPSLCWMFVRVLGNGVRCQPCLKVHRSTHWPLWARVDQYYSMRPITISHVKIWVQGANCEIDEITTWERLRSHRNKDLDLKLCAKSDLEPFQHHKLIHGMNLWFVSWNCILIDIISETSICRMYIAWYDLGILYL